MKAVPKAWYVCWLLIILIVSAFASPSLVGVDEGNAYGSGSVPTDGMGGVEGGRSAPGPSEGVQSSSPASQQVPGYLSKVQSTLLEKVGGKEHVKVFIATTDVPAVAGALEGYEYSGLIGKGAVSSGDQIIVPLLEIPSDAIPGIAALPGVLAIFEYSPPVKHFYETENPMGWEYEPMNLNSTVHHKADRAWASNYTGDGVKIAVIDDGIDFAHPDLMGTQARVDRIYSESNFEVVASATDGQTTAQIQTLQGSVAVPNYVAPIVPGTYKVYNNLSLLSEPAQYTLDPFTGNITFPLPGLAATAKITADFSYYSLYYNWPLAFDPYSMSTYLTEKDTTGTWYTSTNSTNPDVIHTIKIDGTNDFWDDGTELVATDSAADMYTGLPALHLGNDYDLVGLYVTQDERYWYIGLESYANQTNMTFGIYINTTAGGATSDPRGNYVDTVPEHRPEFALYLVHKGSQPLPHWSDNDTVENATIYKWDEAGGTWDGGKDLLDSSVGGNQGYSGWKYEKLKGFLEFQIPRAYMNAYDNISLMAFTTGINPSQPQDTVYSDPAVTLGNPDLTSTSVKTLSSFTIVGKGFWQHMYTRPNDATLGVLNTNRTWPLQYVTTGTSKSGVYYFGDLPDENYPLTRVLMVDESVPGVYDTVYVDLDHNKYFDNDKPVKRLGKYDSQMRWHDLNWTGAGQVYDEMVYADFYDHEWGVTSLNYSPNGSYLATGGNDHLLIIWNVVPAAPTIHKYLNAHMGRVTDVEFSPNGASIAASYEDASGGGYNNVVVWDFATGLMNNVFAGHADKVTAVAWSPTGTELASSSLDGTVKIWDVPGDALLKTFDAGGPILAMDWSALDRIAAGVGNKVKFWNAADPPATPPFEVVLPEAVASISFNPNGTWLAVGEYNDLVLVIEVSTGNFDPSDGQAAHTLSATVLSVAWSPNGLRMISTSSYVADYTMVLWQVDNYDNIFQLGRKPKGSHLADVTSSVFSPSGTTFAAGSRDNMVKTWDPATINSIAYLKILAGHSQGSKDYTRYNSGDGDPDVSGGMVYYLSTLGIPIPYSETYMKRLVGVDSNKVPENGQLVAFMGAMDKGQGHGTLVASAITGQGRTVYYDETSNTETAVANVVGMAPNAKLIAIANIYMTNIFHGWYFAVEGLDGELNTGDEAVIATNSYGFSNIYPDGWNFYDRFVDWISLDYSNGHTAFVFSAGNDGYGYGTLSTPAASSGVITVGASTDFGYRPQAGLEKGPSPAWGDMAPISARGPTAMGKPDPDVVANGWMSYGATALNQVSFAPNYNGTRSSEIWSGTSLSAPSLSGIMALAYEAYFKVPHTLVNETLVDFLPLGGQNVSYLIHAPVDPGSYLIYRNGTALSPADYSLDLSTGRLVLNVPYSTSDRMTATYRFRSDYPDALAARSIVMSSADNMNYDPLSQGAGMANAERAVMLASGMNGVSVSPNSWNPGDYQGTKYEAFASFMKPGAYENSTFTLANENKTAGVTLDISDAVFRKMGEVHYYVNTTLDGLGNPAPQWSFIYPTNFEEQNISGAGAYMVVDPSKWVEKTRLASIDESMWLNAELMKISAVTNISFLDTNLDGNLDHNYWLDVYDWTTICPGTPCDYKPDLTFTSPKDLNRFNVDTTTANVLEVRVRNPAQRIHDGLGIAIRPTTKGAANITYKITLEFYNKTDWNWLVADGQTVLGAGSGPTGIKTFNANLSVPLGTPIGSYEGGIYIQGEQVNANETTWGRDTYPEAHIKLQHDNVVSANVYENGSILSAGADYQLFKKTGVVRLAKNATAATNITVDYWFRNVTTIPVIVNVPSETVDFRFGNNSAGQDELFMNKVTGGFGKGGKSGDWRFYFVDLPDQGTYSGTGAKFFLNVSWDNNLTDIDVFSFGKGGSNPAGIQYSQGRYGPTLFMEKKGGSDETGAFYTTTNKNREIIIPPLTGGLNVIAIHNVKFNGTTNRENVSGVMGFLEALPAEIQVVSKDLYGSRNVTIYSSVELTGLGGVAAGPSAPDRTVNNSIKQDDVSGSDFVEMLSKGSFTKTVKVDRSALILGVNTTSTRENVLKPCKDLDLGVFLDGKGADNSPDGKAQKDELVSYDADQDAEERVKIVRPPVEDDPDTPAINEADEGAPYIIKVLGYDTGGTCLFNIDVNLVQGMGFTVEGATTDTISPFSTRSIGVSWVLSASTQPGEFMGAFYVGPSDAPMALLIPIELTIEKLPPAISEFRITTPMDVNYIDGVTTNDPAPLLTVGVEDATRGELDWQSAKVYLDGEDITSSAEVSINYADPDGKDGPLKYGYWRGTLSYMPPAPLPDGTYSMRFEIKDLAGNEAVKESFFRIDTVAPSLSFGAGLSSGELFTRDATVTIEGTTEQYATVVLRGANLTAGFDGTFSETIDLEPGMNDVTVTAIDWYGKDIFGNLEPGNVNEKSLLIVRDELAPVLSYLSNTSGTPTNGEMTVLSGVVSESVGITGSETPWNPDSVSLWINDARVFISANGDFSLPVLLNEGTNAITMRARDLAGNEVVIYQNITRDSVAPILSLDPTPSSVESNVIAISGTAEPGAKIFLNGEYKGVSNGSFSYDVVLGPGLNTITVEVRDAAGNSAPPTKVTVEYEPQSALSQYRLPLIAAILVLVFLMGLVLGMKSGGSGKARKGPGGLGDEGAQGPGEGSGRESMPEAPRDSQSDPGPEPGSGPGESSPGEDGARGTR